MVSGVQSGKTTALVVRLLWDLANNRDSDFLAVAPTYAVLNQAFLPKFERLSPPGLVESYNGTTGVMRCRNGNRVFWRSADRPDRLKGVPALAVYCDEAYQFSTEAWQVLLGRVASTQGRIWIATTPVVGWSWVYELVQKAKEGDPEYFAVCFPSWESPYFPREEAERRKRELPDHVWRVEYAGEFVVEVEGAVFPLSLLEPVLTEAPLEGEPEFLGVDVGRTHDLTAVAGLTADGELCLLKTMRNKPFAEQRDDLAGLIPRVQKAVIDASGLGRNLAEDLQREFGSRVQPLTFTGSTLETLVNHLKVALENRELVLPKNSDLVNELLSFRYETLPSGKVRIAFPSTSEGHCDRAMALLLANYARVKARPKEIPLPVGIPKTSAMPKLMKWPRHGHWPR